MNETTVLIIQFFMALVTSGVIGGIVSYFSRRDNNRVKVELAKVQVARDEVHGDAATTSGLLTVATTAIGLLQSSLEPFRQTLESSAASNTKAAEAIDALLKRTDEMHLVVDRRDQETQQDRAVRDDHHKIILDRLDAQQLAIDTITRQITISTDENTLRAAVVKLVILITQMAQDVKMLRPDQAEPGEHEAAKAEAAPIVSVTQEGKESP